jgi:iron complex outermembrane receptor protein
MMQTKSGYPLKLNAMRRFILCLTFNLIIVISFGQQTFKGYIKDSSGLALPGATVKILQTLRGSATDVNGYFEIRHVTFPIVVEYSSVGFKSLIDTVDSKKASQVLEVHLLMDVYIADEFIVSATRAEASSPFTHANISTEKIQDMNIGRDVPYVLNQTPSVVSSSDAGTGIGYTSMRIRGVDQTNINVTINGISLNDAESHAVYWVDVPDISSSLSDIQIQRGVGTSTNGAGAFGATVNLLTDKSKKEAYGEILSSAGSFNTYKGSIKFGSGVINERWSIDGRLSQQHSDGYIDRARSDLSSYFLSMGYNNGKTSVKALVFGGLEETYQAWYGVDKYTLEKDRTFNYAGLNMVNEVVKGYYDNQVDHYQQNHYQLHLNQQINKHMRLNLAAHYTRGLGYYESLHKEDDLSLYGIDSLFYNGIIVTSTDVVDREWLDNDYYGMTYNLNYTKDKLKVDFGGSVSRYDGLHFGEIQWMSVADGYLPGYRYYENRGLKDDASAYLKINRTFGKKISVLADLQLRAVNYNVLGNDKWFGVLDFKDEQHFFNPKIGMNYVLNKKNELYYSAALANREPNRNDYLNAVNFEAKPEQLIDQELGHRFRFGDYWVQSNVYLMYYIDQLVLTGEINRFGEPLRDNIGKSYRAGLEISANIKLLKNLIWLPNASLSQNRNLNFVQADQNGVLTESNTPLAYSPEVIVNNALAYQPLKSLFLTLYSYYIGNQYLDNSGMEVAKLKAYQFHDVKVEYRKGFKHLKSLTLYISVNNVLDATYESNGYMYYGEAYYFPQAGINYLAGINLKF